MKVLEKLYKKSELAFTLILIGIYIISMSIGDNLSTILGIDKLVTFIFGFILSLILFIFLKKNNLLTIYGFKKSSTNPKSVLYYIPCLILLTANLWFDIKLNLTIIETILYILTMFCVGFLEELIFRGFLFNTMKKDNLKIAILVSSLTFGFGHIVNLFNGSGMDLAANFMQVIYASAAGFMFVMIYEKTDSLLICILVHALFNSLSVFYVEPSSIVLKIITSLIITLITGLYGIYLYNKKIS